MTYEVNEGYGTRVEEDAYFDPYPYERMCMIIDDTGIVELQWTSPMNVTDFVSTNAAIISLDQAVEIFKTQFLIQNVSNALTDPDLASLYAGMEMEIITDEDISTYEYIISHITLGLTRVAIKDKPDEYMLVPVWDFFGYEHVEYVSPVNGSEPGETMTSQDFDCSVKSFITINAIDGSIIDRSIGY